jgi:antitoxin ParD1/3/4
VVSLQGLESNFHEYQSLTILVIWSSIENREVLPMNVSLTPELDQFVAAKVKSGRYNSASEVVREALRLLEEHDRARASQLTAFNKELAARLAALDHGEHVEPNTARGRLELKSRERRKRRA